MSIARSPNERATKLTGRDYISFSALATYQQCPLKYRFRYVDQLAEESVAANLLFGAAFHKAMERYFRELMSKGVAPTLDTLLGEYEDYWRSQSFKRTRYKKAEDRSHHTGVALRMFRTFLNSEYARPAGHIIGVEAELREPLLPGCPSFRARLDLLIETETSVTVSDLKTSRSRWGEGQVLQASEQLLLYGALVQQSMPEKEVRLQFIVITKGRSPSIESHEVPLSPKRVEQTKDRARQTWQSIDAEQFPAAPSPSKCASCPFQKPCRAELRDRSTRS